jgi:hypothetical protein
MYGGRQAKVFKPVLDVLPNLRGPHVEAFGSCTVSDTLGLPQKVYLHIFAERGYCYECGSWCLHGDGDRIRACPAYVHAKDQGGIAAPNGEAYSVQVGTSTRTVFRCYDCGQPRLEQYPEGQSHNCREHWCWACSTPGHGVASCPSKPSGLVHDGEAGYAAFHKAREEYSKPGPRKSAGGPPSGWGVSIQGGADAGRGSHQAQVLWQSALDPAVKKTEAMSAILKGGLLRPCAPSSSLDRAFVMKTRFTAGQSSPVQAAVWDSLKAEVGWCVGGQPGKLQHWLGPWQSAQESRKLEEWLSEVFFATDSEIQAKGKFMKEMASRSSFSELIKLLLERMKSLRKTILKGDAGLPVRSGFSTRGTELGSRAGSDIQMVSSAGLAGLLDAQSQFLARRKPMDVTNLVSQAKAMRHTNRWAEVSTWLVGERAQSVAQHLQNVALGKRARFEFAGRPRPSVVKGLASKGAAGAETQGPEEALDCMVALLTQFANSIKEKRQSLVSAGSLG